MLSDEDQQVRYNAAFTLMAHVFMNKVNVMCLMCSTTTVNVMSPLMKLIREDNSCCKESASGFLWNVSFVSTIREDVICKRRVILSLISLLTDENTDVRRNAAGTLCNLAYDNIVNQKVICEAGGVEALIKLLMDESVDVRIQAAAALSKRGLNVSTGECQLRLGETMDSNEDDYEVITCADPSKALFALIFNISDDALTSKYISWLVPCVMLLSNADVTAQRKASIAMLHFCEESKYHEIIREVGGISALRNCLSNENEEIVRNVSKALKYLEKVDTINCLYMIQFDVVNI
jgi:hypothetical protein